MCEALFSKSCSTKQKSTTTHGGLPQGSRGGRRCRRGPVWETKSQISKADFLTEGVLRPSCVKPQWEHEGRAGCKFQTYLFTKPFRQRTSPVSQYKVFRKHSCLYPFLQPLHRVDGVISTLMKWPQSQRH